jgi:GDP-4-dehydro-6-deoxy-D-mannose reductase
MPGWLVTGGAGFLGRFLLDTLKQSGQDSQTLVLGRRVPEGWPSSRFLSCDLTDPKQVARAFETTQPSHILHAAGRTPPAPSDSLYRANTLASANLLAAVNALAPGARVVLCGSAAELGPVPTRLLPISEQVPCRPADPYGLSKWAATRLGLSLAATRRSDVVIARVFNLVGPGMPANQALGRFARLLASSGSEPSELITGNLAAKRDFVDVRDAAAAILALASHPGANGIYHVGTGQSRSIEETLHALITISGRSVRVRVDPASRRASGPADSRSDSTRLATELGWHPRIPFETSLRDLWLEARSESARLLVA